MTIVATLTDGEKLISISDGMISRANGNKVSNVLSQVQKFICFRPCVKVPSIMMGRIDGIQKSHRQEMYLAYAGNYSTVSAIASEFGSIVNSQLFAWPDDDTGKKKIYRDATLAPFRIGDLAFDDLKGHHLPLAPFGVVEAGEIIEELIYKHAGDFAFQQSQNPDVEIQLFGKGGDSMECVELSCKKLSEDSFASGSLHPRVEVTVNRVDPYRLSILGNASVKSELRAEFDDRLQKIAETAAVLEREVDELIDPNDDYKLLSSELSKAMTDVVRFTTEAIARNKDGVGGEAKVLSYHPAGGYSIAYIPQAE
ncbi:hypothetical protein [Rhizobium leguminosarum]